MLDLSKQRINQIITKLRKHLIDNKDKLHLGDYDINNNETNKIDNKPIIAYNEDEGIEFIVKIPIKLINEKNIPTHDLEILDYNAKTELSDIYL